MLVGREAERAALRALVDDARAGRGGALVVRGEAGIGKSALLADAEAYGADFRVVRIVGVEAESMIAFAALDQAIRPFRRLLAQLPRAQVEALRGTVSGDGPAPEPFAVALAALDLLAAAAEVRPLLLSIDDAHWLDQPSTDAFSFIGRRLDAEPVAMVVATRESAGRESRRGLPELRLGELAELEALQLLESSGRRVAPRVAAEVVRATGGHPLALEEALRLLSDGQLLGSEELPARLPTGDTIEDAYRRRLGELPPPAQRALLVAAAAETDDPAVIAAAASRVGADAAALQQDAAHDLVRVDRGRVLFRHTLARSAIYHAAPLDERRAAHRAIAEALTEPEDVDRRAWHRAAASAGPDEEIASELERSAVQALRRGGLGAAAATLRRAAELTPRLSDRVDRLAGAADAARGAGRLEDAVQLAGEGLRLTDDRARRTRLLSVAGMAEYPRDFARAIEAFLAAADLLEPAEPDRAILMLAQAIECAAGAGDYRRAARLTERVLALHDPSSALSTVGVALSLAWSARTADALEAAARLSSDDSVEIVGGDPHLMAQVGYAHVVCELYDAAETILERAVSDARAATAVGVLPYVLQIRCSLLTETGRWAACRAEAEEAVELGEEIGAAVDVEFARVGLGWLAGAQGREEECRERLERAEAAAASLRVPELPTIGRAGLGLLHLARGETAAAVTEFEIVRRIVRECGGNQQPWTRWLPNLAEAYARDGRRAEAEELLAGAPEWSRRDALNWGAAAESRCRGLLADDFDDAFEDALSLHERVVNPFERARTELCYGERLRRARRRADARPHLRQALMTFERLGAEPWGRRARAELEATGVTVGPQKPQPLADLTPHELRIAGVVASGAKNTEIAARLFVTPKTVEYHLRSIYRKLNIRSRADLVRLYLLEQQALPE